MLRFKLCGSRVAVSLWFPLMFALLCAFGNANTAVCFFSAAAIHELGHMVMMLAVGERVEEIGLYLGRIEIKQRESSDISARKMIAIYFGGVVFNLLGIVLSLGLGWKGFMRSNLLLLLFNITPCRSFDGGRICELIMELNHMTPCEVERMSKFLSYAAGCLFAGAALGSLALGAEYIPSALTLLVAGVKACFTKDTYS